MRNYGESSSLPFADISNSLGSSQRGVRLLIAQAGLDASLRISRQEPGRIHQIITAVSFRSRFPCHFAHYPSLQARTQWPYLRKFEGGWPVRELIQSTLRNRRYRDKQRKKTVARKAKNRRNELQRARADDMRSMVERMTARMIRWLDPATRPPIRICFIVFRCSPSLVLLFMLIAAHLQRRRHFFHYFYTTEKCI